MYSGSFLRLSNFSILICWLFCGLHTLIPSCLKKHAYILALTMHFYENLKKTTITSIFRQKNKNKMHLLTESLKTQLAI